MSLDEQQATIRRSIDLLEACGGKKVTGWASPVVAFTPETAGYLAKAGLTFTTDVTYADLPIKIRTEHGVIAGVPTTDFSDNRVMRASPRDFLDAHKGTFDYLVANEPMGLHVLVLHCQFGGRPLMTAVIQELLASISPSRPTSGSPPTPSWRAGRSPPTSTSIPIGVKVLRRCGRGAASRARRRARKCSRTGSRRRRQLPLADRAVARIERSLSCAFAPLAIRTTARRR